MTAYHYTSVQALFEIVKSKRFRLSNVFFMNDYMEVEWLWQLVREDIKGRRGLHTGQDLEYFGFLKGQMGHVPKEQAAERRFDYVFCGCSSGLADDLTQWRAYADDGRGLAIGVEIAEVVAANRRENASCEPLRECQVECSASHSSPSRSLLPGGRACTARRGAREILRLDLDPRGVTARLLHVGDRRSHRLFQGFRLAVEDYRAGAAR